MSVRGDSKLVAVIDHVERAGCSVNGNPTYDVFLVSGDVLRTMSDSGWSYEANNADNRGVELEFDLTPAGRIRYARKLH